MEHDHPLIAELARQLRRSATGAVVLTGAGISVASGVPSFRGHGGLWERYDPYEVATIDALRRHPVRVWEFLRELDAIIEAAQPNAAHTAIAALEHLGLVSQVVTQNVDSLHQDAGSSRVIELHGSNRTLTCLTCGARYRREELLGTPPGTAPTCLACGGILKPDVTFFGEPLPTGAFQRADHAVRACDLLLVVGTSAEIDPAARLPVLARHHGARVWEINPAPEIDADGTIAAPAEQVLPRVVERLGSSGSLRQMREILGSLLTRRR